MLGYLKCEEGELLVKHHRLYSAAYCGLCRSIRKNRLKALLPFFSYEFVFLSLIRLLVTGEEVELEKDFCLFHPFRRKKQRLADNRALSYSAFAAAVLVMQKMEDDRLDGDTPFLRRVLSALYRPYLRRAVLRCEKKDPSLSGLSQKVEKCLEKGRELEKAGADLDLVCANFGECLALLMSWGTQGNEQRFLSAIGEWMGKYIYTLDALDDVEKDLATGSFNPLLQDKKLPDEKTLSQLDLVQAFYVAEMKKILDLLDGDRALFCICENIICKGLPAQMKKIIMPRMGETK